MKSIQIILFCFWTLTLSAQTTDTVIHKIERTKSEIEKRKTSLKQKEIILNKEESKIAYFNEDNLELISVRQIETNINKSVNWYFKGGVLMLSKTNWVDQKTNKIIKSEKQYLNNGHLIAWINSDNKFVDNNGPEFIKLDNELAEYGQKILNEATR